MIALPFKAVRPRPEFVAEVNVPPYDVVSHEEAVAFVQDKPRSFFHVTRADVDMPGYDEHDQQVYYRARENFEKMLSEGTLTEDQEPRYYVYSQTWRGETRTGVFVSVSVDEYENNLIKKHELTRPDKEEDRTKLLLTLEFNIGPVFMLFQDQPGYQELVGQVTTEQPVFAFTDENKVENRLWVCPERLQADFQAFFTRLDAFYIADGHHRAAAAANGRRILREKNTSHTGKEDYNFFMAVVFPASSLRILSYNRLVHSLPFESEKDFLIQVGRNFQVDTTEAWEPARKGEILVFLKSGRYVITPRPGSYDTTDPVKNLDVSILQDNLLDPILHIHDVRTSRNISFVGGIKGSAALDARVQSGQAAVGFALYPVDIQELIAISDQGQIMPPKSTWFEPKLRSGLCIHRI